MIKQEGKFVQSFGVRDYKLADVLEAVRRGVYVRPGSNGLRFDITDDMGFFTVGSLSINPVENDRLVLEIKMPVRDGENHPDSYMKEILRYLEDGQTGTGGRASPIRR